MNSFCTIIVKYKRSYERYFIKNIADIDTVRPSINNFYKSFADSNNNVAKLILSMLLLQIQIDT